MSNLIPDSSAKLSHRTPSPLNAGRPLYVAIQDGQGHGHDFPDSAGSGATTPHGHPLPSYFRPGPGPARQREITPVPYAKLLPLCLARIAEGMIVTIIMPYVNEMILSFGVNENDVGIWSAIAVSHHFVNVAHG
jgi:hypothetical protein